MIFSELMECARFGDLEDILSFMSDTSKFDERMLFGQDDNGNTLLHVAAANAHIDIVMLMAPYLQNPQNAAFINLVNKEGNAALHWAAICGHEQVVKTLLQIGADSNLKNKAGRNALLEAQSAGHEATVNILMEVTDVGDDSDESSDEEIEEESDAPTASIPSPIQGQSVFSQTRESTESAASPPLSTDESLASKMNAFSVSSISDSLKGR